MKRGAFGCRRNFREWGAVVFYCLPSENFYKNAKK